MKNGIRVRRSMLILPIVLLLAAVCGPLVATDASAAQGDVTQDVAQNAAQRADLLALGQRIYREGVRATGTPLAGIAVAGAHLTGKDAACMTCHRRRGFGTTEGSFTIRPIIGPALLQEQTVPIHAPRIKARLGTGQRPPYTEALLARALRSGLDAAGKPLDPVMPRYTLTDEEAQALAAYLFSLSTQPSPGVDAQEIHFATVIQPGVSPARRNAMLGVMQAFVKDKDANVRSDERRREVGNMRMYRAYRKWVLHTWELSGASDTWNAQLEAYYKQQPVFALVGGLGDVSWRPIHEFSERFEIPSVFPLVDLPEIAGNDYYTVYLSRGVVLEAEVIAKFLRERAETGKVIQVYRRGDAGAVAAAAFRSAVAANSGVTLEEQVLEGPATEAFWRQLYGANATAVVLWLRTPDLESASSPVSAAAPAVYLSANLLGSGVPATALRESPDVRLVYPSDLPPKREARLLRNKVWLHNKGIAITEEAVQINTQFTMTVVSDVVGHVMDSFSRDYFIERLEHVVGQTPMASIFPSVSLGPGQRFAAKGSSIVQVVDGDKKQWKPLSGWIVP